MEGYTAQLGPHVQEEPKVKKVITFVKAKSITTIQHPLLLVALLSLSLNITLVFMKVGGQTAKISDNQTVLAESKKEESLGSDDASNQLVDIQDSFHYSNENPNLSPNVSAESYLIGDPETGEVIFQRGSEKSFPMASVSKLMTAVVAYESLDLHHYATVSKNSYNTFGTQGELGQGEKILVSDLVYPLLIESSNDAAEVIADDYGRDAFLVLMNKKAETIGMSNTFYEDPSGLSPNNKSATSDLFKLSKYIWKNHPEIYDITRVKQYAISKHQWKNLNAMLSYDNFAGGKNGFIDEAKKTTVANFEIPFNYKDEDGKTKNTKRTLTVVLLRSNDRNTDIASLLNYIKSNIRYTP